MLRASINVSENISRVFAELPAVWIFPVSCLTYSPILKMGQYIAPKHRCISASLQSREMCPMHFSRPRVSKILYILLQIICAKF